MPNAVRLECRMPSKPRSGRHRTFPGAHARFADLSGRRLQSTSSADLRGPLRAPAALRRRRCGPWCRYEASPPRRSRSDCMSCFSWTMVARVSAGTATAGVAATGTAASSCPGSSGCGDAGAALEPFACVRRAGCGASASAEGPGTGAASVVGTRRSALACAAFAWAAWTSATNEKRSSCGCGCSASKRRRTPESVSPSVNTRSRMRSTRSTSVRR